MKIYLVGGAVRDNLLGNPVQERDWVVVGSTPQEMLELGYRQVGKDFPVFLHPKTHEEYALARTERSTGRGYAQFSFDVSPSVTLEEDLLRRDITINAMAQTPEGKIIDPYNGQADLHHKIIRHVSAAFAEDPVRILRVGRFSARYAFTLASETRQLMRNMVRAGEIDALVPERVWQELSRALGEPYPEKFFEVLRECGALKILFPEINTLYGIPNPPKWHPEIDTGIHTMMVLTQAVRLSLEPVVRFAALLHDVGKGVTPMSDWPSHHNHEALGVPLVKALILRYRIPREFAELAVMVVQHHGHCHGILAMKPSTIIKLLEQLDAFRRPARFEQFLLACEADSRGRPSFEDHAYPQADYLRTMYHAANKVIVQSLLEKGFQGKALGDALHQARIDAIKAVSKT
ncbi:MAG: multifunctional CCA addition/repair protein [Gammaproteobacteria bacterium]